MAAEVTSSSMLDGPAHAAAATANGSALHGPTSQQQNGVSHHEVRVLLYGGFSGGGIDGVILSINPGKVTNSMVTKCASRASR